MKNEKIIPWSIRKCDYHDLTKYIDSLEVKEVGISPVSCETNMYNGIAINALR